MECSMNSEITLSELKAVAQSFGTPIYVLDTVAFRARLDELKAIFGPSIRLCYSIKANPFLVATAADAGYMLEVCSPGELHICKYYDVNPKQVLYSGVCKGVSDIQEALSYGVCEFTAESPSQFELVRREALQAGRCVNLLLRLNGGSQFGMSRNDLERIVAHHDSYIDELGAGVKLVGIHYFVGTQRKKLKHQRREMDMLKQLAHDLKEQYSWEAERLEYGPGLAVPYFEDEDFSDTLAPARELGEDLRELAKSFDLTVEMGRFLASECGSYLTTIVDLKDGEDEKTRYAMVDGGINHINYLGQMMGLKLPLIENLGKISPAAVDEGSAVACNGAAYMAAEDGQGSSDTNSGNMVPWTLCGSLCTTNDVLVRKFDMPLSCGDCLVFRNVGAYSITEAMFLFLSRTMPRIVVRHAHGEFELARDFVETSMLNVSGKLVVDSLH